MVRATSLAGVGSACYCLLICSSLAVAQTGAPDSPQLVAPTEPLTAEEQQWRFHLQPGFEIQLVAAEPEIQKPINLNFDAAGRLYVTDSVEYPYAAAEGAPHRDTIKILEDFAPDGRAGTVTTFADGLNIPIGVTPTPRGVLAWSIPHIYRFEDTDGDGRAERREPLYGPFGFVDVHGNQSSFTRWIDGWIYACHGFANTSEVQGTDGEPIAMNSGSTYRMRPDGSRLEYFTHGQVNPFGLCFDPLGNLYSADCHSMPIYMLLRGAWYPSFGKPHDGLGFGPHMLNHSHGSTGIAGVVYYAADQFPHAYRDTVFIGNPVTGRINHDRLTAAGSTYTAVEQPDFLTCDDPWFRPVSLLLGPDGAIWVADFYNRIIGHYEVPLEHPGRDRHRGRIWRIVYRGENDAVESPQPNVDLTQLSADDLIARLANANLTLRTLATHELVDRIGSPSVQPLRALWPTGSQATQRAHALWVLERLGALDAPLVRQAATDPDPLVRVHLLKVLANRRDWAADLTLAPLAREKLTDADAFVRRAAADALAPHPELANVEPLLNLWDSTSHEDTHLVHTVRMALRDQLREPGAYARLGEFARQNPLSRLRLAEVSLGLTTSESAAFLLTVISEEAAIDRERLGNYLRHAARWVSDDMLPSIYGYAEIYMNSDRADQLCVLTALEKAALERGVPLPEAFREWGISLAESLLRERDERDVRSGIELSRNFKIGGLRALVADLAEVDSRMPTLRADALDACVAIDAPSSEALVARILQSSTNDIPLRQKAAQLLGQVNSDTGRVELVAALAAAPERLAVDVAAALASTQPGGELLLAAAAEGKASRWLISERSIQNRLRAAKVSDVDQRIAALVAGLPAADDRIRRLIDERRDGFTAAQRDTAIGQQVFEKHCAACHAIGARGAKIGPELDGIGLRGLERLLEDLLDPSRNVDQAFRSTLVITADGQVVSGLALREEGDVLVLADNQGKEVRVPIASIENREASMISPMPANVPDLIPHAEFFHLLDFLLAQRVAPLAAPAR